MQRPIMSNNIISSYDDVGRRLPAAETPRSRTAPYSSPEQRPRQQRPSTMPTKKRRVLRVRAPPPPPPPHHRRPLPSLVVALVVVVAVVVVTMSDPAGCEIANDHPADDDAMMMPRDGDVAFVVGVVDPEYDNDDDDDDDGGMTTATTSHDRSAAVAPTTSRGLEFLRGGGGAGTTGRRDGGGRGGRSGGIFRRAFSRAVGGGLPGAIAGIVQVLSMMWVVSCFIFRCVSRSFVRSSFFPCCCPDDAI